MSCPNCGYCPTCGRANPHTIYYNYPYYNPTYYPYALVTSGYITTVTDGLGGVSTDSPNSSGATKLGNTQKKL